MLVVSISSKAWKRTSMLAVKGLRGTGLAEVAKEDSTWKSM